MVTLIDNTVSVTTRHSESVPIASEVAMALANREEATGAGWFAKPTVPGNRIMLWILQDAGRITPRFPSTSPPWRAILRRAKHRKRRNQGKG